MRLKALETNFMSRTFQFSKMKYKVWLFYVANVMMFLVSMYSLLKLKQNLYLLLLIACT